MAPSRLAVLRAQFLVRGASAILRRQGSAETTASGSYGLGAKPGRDLEGTYPFWPEPDAQHWNYRGGQRWLRSLHGHSTPAPLWRGCSFVQPRCRSILIRKGRAESGAILQRLVGRQKLGIDPALPAGVLDLDPVPLPACSCELRATRGSPKDGRVSGGCRPDVYARTLQKDELRVLRGRRTWSNLRRSLGWNTGLNRAGRSGRWLRQSTRWLRQGWKSRLRRWGGWLRHIKGRLI
jgi:hypothetical protein